MESTAEQRHDAVEAEIAALERQLAELRDIDPSRFERRLVKPTRNDTTIVRYEIIWVY
jgi:hypothetical protein